MLHLCRTLHTTLASAAQPLSFDTCFWAFRFVPREARPGQPCGLGAQLVVGSRPIPCRAGLHRETGDRSHWAPGGWVGPHRAIGRAVGSIHPVGARLGRGDPRGEVGARWDVNGVGFHRLDDGHITCRAVNQR